ncbi:rhodanese-like domain-containing protein [Glutamicibacter sp.]|uniref:rhodanese-like domain-containing protein n=1 Tax=Glutamicibacter sp. TaxID=1931995 RepID=UPI003D6A9F6A
MTTPLTTMDAEALKCLVKAPDADLALIDVRTAGEFETLHISGSYNVPLEEFTVNATEVLAKIPGKPVLICHSGNRAAKAQRALQEQKIEHSTVLLGGVTAYENAGGIMVRGVQRWALDRQMRMTAGSVVLAGLLGAKFISPKFAYLSAAIGGGLVFSALRDSCPMISFLGKMPWNKVKK